MSPNPSPNPHEIWEATHFFMARIIGEDRGLFDHWQDSKPQFSPAFNEVLQSMAAEHQ